MMTADVARTLPDPAASDRARAISQQAFRKIKQLDAWYATGAGNSTLPAEAVAYDGTGRMYGAIDEARKAAKHLSREHFDEVQSWARPAGYLKDAARQAQQGAREIGKFAPVIEDEFRDGPASTLRDQLDETALRLARTSGELDGLAVGVFSGQQPAQAQADSIVNTALTRIEESMVTFDAALEFLRDQSGGGPFPEPAAEVPA